MKHQRDWPQCEGTIHTLVVFSAVKNRLQMEANNLQIMSLEVLATLAQMVACLPLLQLVQGSIPGGVVNFHLKIKFSTSGLGGMEMYTF